MTLFWILWNFSYMLCSPFFAYYILGEMQINFMTYTIGCLITSSLTSLIILPFWGKMIDRVGCKPVIKIAFAATGALGFIWILAKRGNPWIPVIFFIIGGFFWCVNDLASQHMLISQTPAKNKAAYIATFSVLTAVLGNAPATLVSGALLGLFEKATVLFGKSNGQPLLDRYQILFIFASIIRILFIGIFADKILDPSSSCPISSRRKK